MATLHPRGVNHLAIPVGAMSTHLPFWCDVLGMPLKALFWMHNTDGVYHAFVEMAPNSYISLVEDPRTGKDSKIVAADLGDQTAVGAVHHIAMDVDSLEDVLALRDRIRSRGIQVLGPIDHGWWQSIYFAGPDNVTLEITTGGNIQAKDWVDPAVAELCGFSSEELERLKNPAPYDASQGRVPQPEEDPSKPRMLAIALDFDLDKVMQVPDEEVWEKFSETDPPVASKE